MQKGFTFAVVFLTLVCLFIPPQTIFGKQKIKDRINFVETGKQQGHYEIPYRINGAIKGVVVFDTIGLWSYKIAIKDNDGVTIDTLSFGGMWELSIGTIDLLNKGTDLLFLGTYTGGSGGNGPIINILNIQRAEMICGAHGQGGFKREHFPYRSSRYLTEFFLNCGMDYEHFGETRKYWVRDKLEELNSGPASNPGLPANGLVRVIQELMDPYDFREDNLDRDAALVDLNFSLDRNNIQAYFDDAGRCHLHNMDSQATSTELQIQRRAWTKEEIIKRKNLSEFLDNASEDEIIEEILLPIFQQLGFMRVTVCGHKDKALEFGKDMWMKYQLPTTNYLYFGVQVKKSKISAAGKSKNENIANIMNQIYMILKYPIWDPETNQKNLLDHVFIVSASDITKQARNFIAEHLEQESRRCIMFIDRDDILNLAISVNLSLPDENVTSE